MQYGVFLIACQGKWSLPKYLYYLPIPTAVITVLCFAMKIYSTENGGFQNALIIVYGFIIYILWEIVFSFGDIPMISYPNMLLDDEKSRTKLLSLRPIGSMVGSICSLVVQPLAFSASQALGGTQKDERNAFLTVAIVFSAVGALLYQITVPKNRLRQQYNTKTDVEHQYKYIFTNPLLKRIIISGLLSSMSALQGVVLSALVAYYFSSKNSGLTFLYTLLLGTGSFVGLVLSTVFVPALSRKFGNVRAYVLCNLASVLPNILIFIIYFNNKTSMNSALNFSAMFVLMLAAGGFLSFASSIRTLLINDAVELEKSISGNTPTALFFSFQTAIIKIQTGISSLASSIGYTAIGFTSEKTAMLNDLISQGLIVRESSEYTPLFTMLFFLFTVMPAVSSVLAVLPFVKSVNKQRY